MFEESEPIFRRKANSSSDEFIEFRAHTRHFNGEFTLIAASANTHFRFA
jgi:hypothetical protein